MLFSSKLNQINESLIDYSQQIEDLQRQLEQLREEKKALENHAQQLGSAENAAESALSQVKTALMMVRAVAPSEVETFKAAIDGLFALHEELPVIEAEEEEIEVTVEKVADGGTAVTIEVEQVETDTEEEYNDPEIELADNYLTKSSQAPSFQDGVPMTPEELKKHTTTQLKAIAQYLGVEKKCKYKNDWIDAIASVGVVKKEVEKILENLTD